MAFIINVFQMTNDRLRGADHPGKLDLTQSRVFTKLIKETGHFRVEPLGLERCFSMRIVLDVTPTIIACFDPFIEHRMKRVNLLTKARLLSSGWRPGPALIRPPQSA